MKRPDFMIVGAALWLAGCVTPSYDASDEDGGAKLISDIADAGGRILARATIVQKADGIRVRVEAAGLSPGSYAVHVHAIGRCDGPSFTSAGPHWNPMGRQHGKDNPAGMHKGDLPNLSVDARGRGNFKFTIEDARISGGEMPLLDGDGASIILHAGPDDYRTDPAGNAGTRIACGLLG